MADFFLIVSQVLEGILDISNKAIGILIAWTILGVPLLFILTTFDFLVTLLRELDIIKEEEEN
jgi:hypothetical protein